MTGCSDDGAGCADDRADGVDDRDGTDRMSALSGVTEDQR